MRAKDFLREGSAGISKSAETKFHKKLDNLVHDTFGKRKDEVEESSDKVYTINIRRERMMGPSSTRTTSGTLAELIDGFGYTLEVGKSYEHERGRYKINMNPKTIQQLVDNLNKAKSNAAANGHSSTYYEVADEEQDLAEGWGFGPKPYKGWTYDVWEDDDGDVRKKFHSAKKDGQEVTLDWSPYSTPSQQDWQLWIDLGMPNRDDLGTRGPIRSEDLEKLAQSQGATNEDLNVYNKEDPYNSEFAPRAGMGSRTLRGWKKEMIRRVEELASKLKSAGQDIDKDELWARVYKDMKNYNLDPIAQEIELGQAELSKIRSQGGVRSRAFNKE